MRFEALFSALASHRWPEAHARFEAADAAGWGRMGLDMGTRTAWVPDSRPSMVASCALAVGRPDSIVRATTMLGCAALSQSSG